MVKQISDKKDVEPIDLLQAFEIIVEKAKGSSLGEEFYQEAEPYLVFVSGKLCISKRASVIMALFADRCYDTHIRFSDLTEFLDCRILTLLRYSNETQELIDKEYVCQNRIEGLSYSIPMEVMEAFQHNQRYIPSDVDEFTARELFDKFDELFSKCRCEKLNKQVLRKKLRALVVKNSNLAFVKAMALYDINVEDKDFPLFILLCTLFVIDGDDDIRCHDLDFIYEEGESVWRWAKRDLSQGNHRFLQKKFIEYTNDDGFADRESFKITDCAKKLLFSEMNLSAMQGSRPKGSMLSFESIKPKQLFYNDKERKLVEELAALLDEKNFQGIRDRLKETNFRSGFACLFYGAPGTGKTETVLQIARKTGRDLILVNISDIKSMWVGESEKNIKGIFDDYRKMVKQSAKTPILLFNEADAIIGKRMVGAEKAVDKLENNIQDIILQEIEQLDGILIATTNLAENMDKAFERRFLYKVKFEKPDLHGRLQIWQTMIPSLNDADASFLAARYDFCGGEIENIARHYTIQSILHGKPANMLKSLVGYCDSERLEGRPPKRKVGF
ncbi:ATP-binding protein [Prevotella sp. TF12-30]|uniref:ATP-binding protein n=1 Tax=Prevotellaceae TaxID=171552 RepID=UPI001F2665B3|nr:ATP-binding protein [Prevotella sp. TF12-30]